MEQTFYDKISLFYINIDDNLTDFDYERYNSLTSLDPKIRIKVCPAKWRSCNKLIWVYKDHPDDIIICFDDDKYYPKKSIERLYDQWERNKDCIVAYEINPIIHRENGHIDYLNSIDLKLLQREYGKYLSNSCLFPPRAFTDLLFDYDQMMNITNGNHDELWFWIVSTLNGVKCIGLDYTYSLSIDEGVQICHTESDLTNINANKDVISGYNARLNEVYGDKLRDIVLNNSVEFKINHSNLLSLTGNAGMMNYLYGNFPISIILDDTVPKSWVIYISNVLNRYKWRKLQIFLSKESL